MIQGSLHGLNLFLKIKTDLLGGNISMTIDQKKKRMLPVDAFAVEEKVIAHQSIVNQKKKRLKFSLI